MQIDLQLTLYIGVKWIGLYVTDTRWILSSMTRKVSVNSA